MHFRAQRKSASDVSLSDYIETGKDGTALSLMDVICSDEDLFEQLSDKEIYGKLHQVIGERLDEREKTVITLRYGMGNRQPMTQREVATLCGISRSYVSRIEKKALEKLEEALKE
jgi:RNA polymerase sporulation-specific sigma factor